MPAVGWVRLSSIYLVHNKGISGLEFLKILNGAWLNCRAYSGLVAAQLTR